MLHSSSSLDHTTQSRSSSQSPLRPSNSRPPIRRVDQGELTNTRRGVGDIEPKELNANESHASPYTSNTAAASASSDIRFSVDSSVPLTHSSIGLTSSMESLFAGNATGHHGAMNTNRSQTQSPFMTEQSTLKQTSLFQSPAHPQPSMSQRGTVHIVWSLQDVPLPTSLAPSYAIDRVHRIAESYGSIATFKAIAPNDPNILSGAGAGLLPTMKRCLHTHGVELEEVYSPSNATTNSIDMAIMTNLLRIGMSEVEQQLQALSVTGGSTLILLSNQEELSRALHILRRSSRFTNVVIIYFQRGSHMPSTHHEPIALIRHATVSFEWSELMRHGLPSHTVIEFEQSRILDTKVPLLPSLPTHRSNMSSGSYSIGSSIVSSTSSMASTPSSRVPTPLGGQSSTGLQLNGSSFNFIRSRASSISAASSSLESEASSSASSPSGRSLMGATLSVTPALDSNTTSLSELSVELMLERLPTKIRTMVIAFKTVLEYCEQEKIIPRSGREYKTKAKRKREKEKMRVTSV